jgi:hypothetical protein
MEIRIFFLKSKIQGYLLCELSIFLQFVKNYGKITPFRQTQNEKEKKK